MIDRQAQAPKFDRFSEMQHAMQQGQVAVGRNDIYRIRLGPHPILDLDDRHGGFPLEQFDHHVLAGRVEVLDDDKSQAAVGRHRPQERPQGFKPAGGGADADYAEVIIPCGCFWLLFLMGH
jgi:hypothetical protein